MMMAMKTCQVIAVLLLPTVMGRWSLFSVPSGKEDVSYKERSMLLLC